MTSPVVWDDALARAKAAVAPLGLDVQEPTQVANAAATEYILIETQGGVSDRLGLGERVNEEDGEILFHVMVRRGSATRDALVIRKALATVFRVTPDAPVGLLYDGQTYDAPDQSEKGNWSRFSLSIHYRYQDIYT